MDYTENENAYKELKAGDLVEITASTYYGSVVRVPTWIKKQLWYVYKTPTSNMVILGKSENGAENIMMPVDANYLQVCTDKTENMTVTTTNSSGETYTETYETPVYDNNEVKIIFPDTPTKKKKTKNKK